MKLNFNYLLVVILGIVFITSSLSAQRGGVRELANPLVPAPKPSPIYVGPAFGLNLLGHSMDRTARPFTAGVPCPSFSNAAGLGIFGGLTLEYLFGEVETSSSSLIFRALFNMFPGSNTQEHSIYPQSDPQGIPWDNQVENELRVNYNALTFEVMYKINPDPRLGFGFVVGPTFDLLFMSNEAERFNLIAPDHAQFDPDRFDPGMVFENNNRTAVIYDGEILNAAAIRFGLKAGIQYEILLGSRMYVVPSLAYNFGITTLNSEYSWRVSPVQIGLDARFLLGF